MFSPSIGDAAGYGVGLWGTGEGGGGAGTGVGLDHIGTVGGGGGKGPWGIGPGEKGEWASDTISAAEAMP